MLFQNKSVIQFNAYRTLTTPTEEVWPGVSTLPDYKSTFPNWKDNTLAKNVKQLDDMGLDLLAVSVSLKSTKH